MNHVPCALTIAGTDPSGGAGIQADLKTFQELKCYGMSVITSAVAQNTTGVKDVHHLPLDFLEKQLHSISEDMPVHAVKTGMVAQKDMMKIIAEWITKVDAYYVMDPVMISQSGDSLSEEESREVLRKQLLPLTTLVTPNIPEAEEITGKRIETEEDMKEAAEAIVKDFGAGAALVKGGHREGAAIDYLFDGNEIHTFESERIQTKNTHGTGCTYSAAITAYLAQGLSLVEAVKKAKYFVTEAIRYSFELGNGSGPTNHFAIREEVSDKWI
ncbi:bifunctional hydroxymethylpyrimidine kinase/phosphomethylpyrimidine kinase [Halobacillus halophilus]|uniref:bifunctional hydroxymethylpyrimidine kinase/phosphomethylpyrimidine kinase n=1 Tax=Halobacillus halophilus TaxID=1570 RepID=UPI001CD7A872|nr:bifunctional hydroxymethylpyrimidine kinase/phosphomethylpyrimidine kinase [Halobacillus halophilus]MCA1012331.1 bifunctional hydroxymethylpyrimidine kinase/phosphomethylpyrimidine kinase [Halobacillus halophilus]